MSQRRLILSSEGKQCQAYLILDDAGTTVLGAAVVNNTRRSRELRYAVSGRTRTETIAANLGVVEDRLLGASWATLANLRVELVP